MNESFSGTSTVATASGTSWVSVAELLGRQLLVHPSEGVALVAELCAVLLGRGDQVVPHPADVLLNGEGALTIRGPHHGESDSGALGRMLHDLLDPAHAPVPLRLFASQAISSERYQSVTAFSEALASYEVPGRNKLIQAVHKRFVAMPTPAAPSGLPPPLPEPEQAREPAKPDARRRRFPPWAIAPVGIAVVLAGAAAWVAGGAHRGSIPSVSFSVPAVIQHALPWLAAGKPGDTVAAEPETRPAKPARAARPGTARARTDNPVLHPVFDDTTATGSTETALAAGSVAPLVTTVDVTTLTARIVSDTPTLAAAGASSARPASGETPGTLNDVATGADSVVYSSAFPNVKPPVMVTPQITSPRALSPESQAASTIELLVDESGRVERVRLVSQPSRILAMMLLSAAKNWQFKPALNDGRPVKYRLLLDVLTTSH